LAQVFAERGSDVALVARGSDEHLAAARRISAATGRTALAIAQDVTLPDAAPAIDRRLAEAGFYVDVLVNNAAIGLAGPFAGHDPEAIQRLLALNIAAPTSLSRHWLPGMRARRQGGILNVASLGGAVPGPYQAVYYASKAYILSLTEAIGAEIAGEGVRISVLAPGPVETGFHAAMDAETSLYRVLLPSLMPERAARAAHLGFRLGRRVIVPGLLNMGLYGAVRVLPHPISVPLIRILLALRKK
jgi:short-subunit dehydrogenase